MDCDSEIPSDEVNRPLPILNLPPELFLEIVSILILEWPPHTPRWKLIKRIDHARALVPISSGSLGWINITHVCTQWRELCIGTRTLWTRWVGRLPKALPIVLSRAGDEAALDIDINVNDGASLLRQPSPDWGAWDALPPMHRIRAMSWNVPDSYVANWVAARVCSVSVGDASMHLSRLDIHVVGDYALYITHQGDFFRAPSLRTLNLNQAWIKSVHAPSLTVLVLRRPSRELDQNDLYDLLIGCPMLTSLSIIQCLLLPYSDRGQNALPLHHLEHFLLDEATSLIGATYDDILMVFVGALSIPPTAAIEVATTLRISQVSEAKSMFPFCVDNVTQADPPNTLCIYESTFVLSLGTSIISAPYREWRTHGLPSARKRARIDLALDAAKLVPCFIHDYFDRYTSCLHGITVLSLDPPWIPGDEAYLRAIKSLLQALPALRIIRVTSNSYWDELLEPLGSLNPDTGGVLLPGLEALWLDGAYQTELEIGSCDFVMDRVQMHALTSTLITRTRLLSEAGMGRSPRRIFLHGFGSVSPDDACVQLLHSEVAEVVFVGTDS